jgi:hypothetical protein
MLAFSVFAGAWVPLNHAGSSPPWNHTITYSYADDFCAGILDRVRGPCTCHEVIDIVDDVMFLWSRHVPNVHFQWQANGGALRLAVGRLPQGHGESFIGHVDMRSMTLTLSSDACWYLKRSECILFDDAGPWPTVVTLFLITLFAVVLLIVTLYNKRLRHVCTPLALFATVLAVAQNIRMFALCLPCHSLQQTLVHEFGHIMGLGHVDELHNKCGCAVPRNCAAQDSVMKSHVTRFAPDTCLYEDDIDGIYRLYHMCHADRRDACVSSKYLSPVAFDTSISTGVLAGILAMRCLLRARKQGTESEVRDIPSVHDSDMLV